MKRADFKPGQVVTYKGRYAGARAFSGVVIEHADDCATFIHVQINDQRNPGIHHVDPDAVLTIDGKPVAS